MRKPADADAYKTRTIAEAERDARISQAEAQAREVELRATADAKRVKLEADANATHTRQLGEAEASAIAARGEAEGDAAKARGLAEAEAIKARAEALARNHEALIGQQLAEEMPRIVAEAAKAFSSIDNITVLNGAEGFGEMFPQVLGMGAAAIPMLRGALEHNAPTNGADDADGPTRPRSQTP